MYLHLAAFLILPGIITATCSTQWPNGTDTQLNWWQCDNGPIKFYNATTWDKTGTIPEYPIHLGSPLMIKADMYNPSYTFTQPNLRGTVNLWSWGGWSGCVWSAIPTLGLLTNLDACENGVPCPVKPGRQWLDVTVDFSKFQPIINMLTDNAPYQIELLLHDNVSKVDGCIMAQARAYLH